jgi:hypothetical protein
MGNLKLGKLTLKDIKKYNLDIMTIRDFRDKYHPDTPVETVSYWITKNQIHYFRPGRERFVVLTKETLSKEVNEYTTKT